MSFSTNLTSFISAAQEKWKASTDLRRSVLLKNFVMHSPTHPPRNSNAYPDEDDDESPDDVLSSSSDVAHDYLFPDAGNFVEYSTVGTHTSEAQWLDSLLETLGDDDDDYYGSDPSPTASPTIPTASAPEDEHLFSPSASPMSSSDDLSSMPPHSYYASSSSSVQYPVISPYPPSSYAFVSVSPFDADVSSLSILPAPYEDPLPFSDDVDDLPVPDTIEDTSDDESDSPPTPMGGSRSSLYSVSDVDVELLDAASIPLPPDRSRLRHGMGAPRVYDNQDCCSPPPFESSPLPFSTDQDDALSSYNLY